MHDPLAHPQKKIQHPSTTCLATIEIWNFFLNFGRIMAIEKPQKKYAFSILYLYTFIYLFYIAKKKG
jgi:hypothetical protein